MAGFPDTVPAIRPISDLRTQLSDVLAQASNMQGPIFLTKNGIASHVIMSVDSYNELQAHKRVAAKLREAEISRSFSNSRFLAEDTTEDIVNFIEAIGMQTSSTTSLKARINGYDIEFAEEAVNDIENALLYEITERQNADCVDEVMERLSKALHDITASPHLARAFRDKMLDRVYREVPLGDQRMYCTAENGLLLVWRIIHPSFDYDANRAIEKL